MNEGGVGGGCLMQTNLNRSVMVRCRRWWSFDNRNKRLRWEWQPAPINSV